MGPNVGCSLLNPFGSLVSPWSGTRAALGGGDLRGRTLPCEEAGWEGAVGLSNTPHTVQLCLLLPHPHLKHPQKKLL